MEVTDIYRIKKITHKRTHCDKRHGWMDVNKRGCGHMRMRHKQHSNKLN